MGRFHENALDCQSRRRRSSGECLPLEHGLELKLRQVLERRQRFAEDEHKQGFEKLEFLKKRKSGKNA